MPAEVWGTRPKAVRQVTHSVHSPWLNLQDPGQSAVVTGASPWEQAVGRITPGDSPRSPGTASGEEGRGICPSPGELGGHSCSSCPGSSSAFVLPVSLGFLLGFALFPPFPGKLAAHLRLFVFAVKDGRNPRIVRAGVKAETFLGCARVLLEFTVLAYESFTYRIVRFRCMKYLYFLVICSF